MSRIENSTKNMYTGLTYQILVVVFRFLTRTVFIKCLGPEYLGINGLFSNILMFLSLVDLGIGASLVYSLYKPIAEGNKNKQRVIVQYLHKTYVSIGLCIILFGFLLMPFLKFFVKSEVNFVNLNLVFLIYIIQTASTYLVFPSRIEFLSANQQRYVYNKIANKMVIISNLSQILILVLFKNFYIYLITIILFNIIQACWIEYKTVKMYPYIKEKTKETLSKEEKKSLYKDYGSLMLSRINYIVLNATDNIIISKYLGLVVVGLYSNYLLITNSVVNLLSTFFDSVTAAIGNIHAKEEKEKDYFMFKLTNIITIVFFGIFAVGVFNLANSFIKIWLGEKYILSRTFVMIISINLYVEGLRKFLSTYRSTYGLFRQAKFLPLFGAIMNIFISVFLVKRIGIFGVLLGTLISNLITFMWFDPYIIYKKVFKKNVIEYYAKNILFFIFFCLNALVIEKICVLLPLTGILGFIVKGVICVSIPLLICVISLNNTQYGKYFKAVIKSKFNKKQEG